MSENKEIILKVKQIPEDYFCCPRLQVVDETSKFNGMILADIELGDSDIVYGKNKIPGNWHTTTSDLGEPISRIKESIVLELIEDGA